MGNQQASHAAWIAGLWLADGYIGMTAADVREKYRGNGEAREYVPFRRYYPRLIVTNADYPVIEYAYAILRGNGVGAHISTLKNQKWNPKWKPVYLLQIHGWQRTATGLVFMRPFLVGRKAVCADLLQLCVNTREGGAGRLTELEREFKDWACRVFNHLNARGAEASETVMPAPPRSLEGEGTVQTIVKAVEALKPQ